MTAGQLKRFLHLKNEDLDEIRRAVVNCEKKTSGEIALAVVSESDNYGFFEIVAAIFASALVFAFTLPFCPQLNQLFTHFFWAVESWVLPVFFALEFAVFTVIFLLLFNIPAIDFHIIPKDIKNRRVTLRAFAHFFESGVSQTESRSGILIFVSALERQVRIIADSGIVAKIPQSQWDKIAEDVATKLKHKDVKSAFIDAVSECETFLSREFPIQRDDKNELRDGLVILEE